MKKILIKFFTSIIIVNIFSYSACSNSLFNYYVFNNYNGNAIAVLCVKAWRLEYPDDAVENVFYITKTRHKETNGKKAFDQNGYLIEGADKKTAILSTAVLLDDKSVVLSITFDINIKGRDFHNETIINVPLFQDVRGVENGLTFTATWRKPEKPDTPKASQAEGARVKPKGLESSRRG
jgi:hypothetical protein